MEKSQYILTLLPDEIELPGQPGEDLLEILVRSGMASRENPRSQRLRLEKGSLSPAAQPEAEAAVFTASQRTEGWFLAGQRTLEGDAVVYRDLDEGEEPVLYDPLSAGYGLAFDLGTGTIAAGLVDLGSMNIPQITACPNSQMRLAAKPEDRQRLARTPEGRAQLRALLLEDMEGLVSKLAARTGVELDKITIVTCAGSSLMLALLAKVPAQLSPGRVARLLSGELGLARLEPLTQVFCLPTVNQDLGADVIAACLAADLLHKLDQPLISLLVDLGMGGEIIGVGRGRMVAASIPILPFEGYGIRFGMPAMTGAITQVELEQRVVLKTVRDGRPRGISGAGLLSAAHALLAAGILDEEGRFSTPPFLPEGVAAHLRGGINGREFVLSKADAHQPQDITISQEDIQNLQMAKGAIFGACQAVLAAMGGEPDRAAEQIGEILLAEAYRAHLSPRDLLAIGMTPAVAPEQMLAIGNAAWQGAFLCLSNRRCLEEAEQIAGIIQPLDLTTDHNYAASFIQGMRFVPDPLAPEPRPRRFRL